MPKETFFNLPRSKRERFERASLREFALHDYRAASVSRIVEKVGIAKGSVYQYFEDKRDLYLYVVELAAKAKFDHLEQRVPPRDHDFFERYKLAVFHGARFDFSQPRHASVLYNATYLPTTPETLQVATMLRSSAIRYIRGIVEDGVSRGDLDDELDVEMATWALYQVTISLKDYLGEKFSFSFEKAVRKGRAAPVSDETLNETLDSFIAMFRHGLSRPASAAGQRCDEFWPVG